MIIEKDPLTIAGCSDVIFVEEFVVLLLVLLEPDGGFLLRRLLLSDRCPLGGWDAELFIKTYYYPLDSFAYVYVDY
uniref:CSON002940 protein n=1 Tax=Culicoides sonorensis TaxID=179676 RepID=A0A336LM33_CULSO